MEVETLTPDADDHEMVFVRNVVADLFRVDTRDRGDDTNLVQSCCVLASLQYLNALVIFQPEATAA